MAIKVQKKKTARNLIRLVCGECNKQNYSTEKNRTNTTERLTIKKFCPSCRRHTEHKESKKK